MRIFICFLLLCSAHLKAQSIKGRFSKVLSNDISLWGFDGLKEYELAKTNTDLDGNFILKYPKHYIGSSILKSKGASNIIVLLAGEDIEIKWDDLTDFKTLEFKNSTENEFFEKAIALNQDIQKKIPALSYLLPLYKDTEAQKKWLKDELAFQNTKITDFYKKINPQLYVSSYIKFRKCIAAIENIKTETEYINSELATCYKQTHFNDNKIWHSGLIKEWLVNYYQMLEKVFPSTSLSAQLIIANQVWLDDLKTDPLRKQEIATFCFNWLEKKGYIAPASQIALAMLNETNCNLDVKTQSIFEQYQKLAIGNTAPNIILSENKNLLNLSNTYKFVIFGASWCPNCQSNYPSLVGIYGRLQKQIDIEFIYISIDTDVKAFEAYYKGAPFITFCDGKGWDSQAAKDYYLNATPTYILMDKNLKIISKITNPYELETYFQK
ncbi:TlpA family protein disulfide reductase [Flavobacterium branchiophilum]|uniref:Thioredoxin domain-containing protein n=1 Tax=Flavobacterium branchiophilum TaxID=55197 RepID=A0A2H3KCW8_9FLAO|nr:thioredoxin family protein [Flavobacterium branchiophilum]PDS24224.1 hypothetical protein B0A77_08800 [Flavobacterium branchiophilum]